MTDTLTRTNLITVTTAVAPNADFSASPLTGTAPLTVTFSNNSTNATEYLWDFGDGNTSTLSSPSHTYTATGVYTVTLSAGDGIVTDTLTRTNLITVTTAVAPNADFSASPLTGTAPLTVTFSNNSTNATEYLWDFGDGNTSTLSSPSHTYTATGVYTVTLSAGDGIVTDTLVRTGYITVTEPAGPSADFSAFPLNGSTPLLVQFLNHSTNATGYEWDFGDGNTSTLSSPSHTYTATGVYTVTLSADDGIVTDTLTRTNLITVATAVAPNADFSASPLTGTAPLTVTFSNNSTNATEYLWDFGDGNTSTLSSPSHTYTATGVYTVTLSAGDGIVTDTLVRTGYITVTEPAGPSADFSAFPLNGSAPLLVQFLTTRPTPPGMSGTLGTATPVPRLTPATATRKAATTPSPSVRVMGL